MWQFDTLLLCDVHIEWCIMPCCLAVVTAGRCLTMLTDNACPVGAASCCCWRACLQEEARPGAASTTSASSTATALTQQQQQQGSGSSATAALAEYAMSVLDFEMACINTWIHRRLAAAAAAAGSEGAAAAAERSVKAVPCIRFCLDFRSNAKLATTGHKATDLVREQSSGTGHLAGSLSARLPSAAEAGWLVVG